MINENTRPSTKIYFLDEQKMKTKKDCATTAFQSTRHEIWTRKSKAHLDLNQARLPISPTGQNNDNIILNYDNSVNAWTRKMTDY